MSTSTLPSLSFEHTSHLADGHWPQAVEAAALPGWVCRGTQVKALNIQRTLMTYSRVPACTPVVAGSSWTNLDLCGGWHRDWRDAEGAPVREDAVIVQRVLARVKLCGEVIADSGGENRFMPSPEEVRDLVGSADGFELRVRPFPRWADRWRCWLAPAMTLGEAVDVESVADFYAGEGFGWQAAAIRDEAGMYLPDLEDFEGTLSAAVCGLVLGYPPASTVSLMRSY